MMRPRLGSVIAIAMFLGSVAVPASAGTSGLGPTSSIDDGSRIPATLDWEVVSRRPHDPFAWTQGLQLDAQGRLFESTGQEGRSSLREVDPEDGTVLRVVHLPEDEFGEGLALVDDARLIQLTWQDGVAHVWDAATFSPQPGFTYDGEGWGLCYDGARLVMSDGSDRLTFRDPATFAVMGSVAVTEAGRPVQQLNELECVDGSVWANVWLTDRIVRVDPTSGAVTGILDLPGLLVADPAPGEPPPDALNGIAWDAAAGTFLVTGKQWPELIEIRVTDQ
jgi:glutamine cyclotransferase